MQIPYLNVTPTSRSMIDAFGGYDHRVRSSENSFYEMENLTGDRYPALSPRAKRGKRALPGGVKRVQAMLSGPKLSYIADNKLYVDDEPVLELGPEEPKQMVRMGAYIIVFPDKVYYNTANPFASGATRAEDLTTTGDAVFKICDKHGDLFGDLNEVGAAEPDAPEDGMLWLDTSGDMPALKRYFAEDPTEQPTWKTIDETFVYISADGIGDRIAAGDEIKITGLPASVAPLNGINGRDVDVAAAGDGWIVVAGIMGAASVTDDAELTISRKLPVPDHKMEADVTTEGNVTFRICDGEGEQFGSVFVGTEPPGEPDPQEYWLDTSVKPSVMKQYSKATGVWTSVISTTVRIAGAGIGKGFSAGDGVLIDGIPTGAKPLNAFNKKTVILTAAGDDYIAIEGIMDAASFNMTEGAITLSRKLPVLDHVFECGNRLWGCRYGENADGEFVNEIYASALGDFKNWQQFRGISKDSYAVSVGSAGAWTGGIAYQGMPHFFKDDVLYRVYGAYPSAYRVEQTACRGVQAGAERSLQILNERLYYKARNGVCVYDGAYPTEISEVFGEVRYGGIVAAGAADNKYYISMQSETDGAHHLFKFDAVLGAWFREDNTEAAEFAVEDGQLCWLTPEGDIATVRGDAEEDVAWRAETGTIFLQVRGSSGEAHYLRWITRLNMQLRMTLGSRVSVEIQYDSKDPWIHVATVKAISLRSFSLPIRPRRCDHFRLRISGKGDVALYSITKTLEEGSDLP